MMLNKGIWLAALLASGTVAAQSTDLSYPPAGSDPLWIHLERDETNSGTLLTPEQARQRLETYDDLHYIITPDYSLRRPVPEPEAQPAATGAAVPDAKPVPAQPAAAAVRSDQFNNGLLWRIQKGVVRPSYLFGTIHLEDPRVLELPDRVNTALNRSRSFCAELDLSQPAAEGLSTIMMYTDGGSLQQEVGDSLYGRVSELLAQKGIPERVVNTLKPWGAMILLTLPTPRTGIFLDRKLFLRASEQGKTTCGLEQPDEQIMALDRIPVPDQVAMLQQTVDQYAKIPQMLESMVQLYLNRDLAGLLAASRTAGEDERLNEIFMRHLIHDRNQRMLERMTPRLTEGSTFIAVGAAHLPGDQGLLALLAHNGYRVTKVY